MPLSPDPQPLPGPASSGAPATPAGEARRPEALREEAVQIIAREDERAGYRRGTAQLAAALSDQGLAPVDNQELFRLFQLYKELRRQQRSQAVVGSPGLQAPAGPAAQTQPAPRGAGEGTTGPVSQGRDGAGAGRRTRTAAPKVLPQPAAPAQPEPARVVVAPSKSRRTYTEHELFMGLLPSRNNDWETRLRNCTTDEQILAVLTKICLNGAGPDHKQIGWYHNGYGITLKVGPKPKQHPLLILNPDRPRDRRELRGAELAAFVRSELMVAPQRSEGTTKTPAAGPRPAPAGETPRPVRSPVPFLDKQIRWARENNKPSILTILVQVRQDVDRALREVRDEALRQAGSAELTLQVVVAAETRAREAEAAARILTRQRDSALAAAQSNLERATARAHKRAEEDFGRDLALVQQAHQADLEKVHALVDELHEQLELTESAAGEAEAQRLSAQTTARREQQALWQDLHREHARSAADAAHAEDLLLKMRTQCARLLAGKDGEIGELSDEQDLLRQEAQAARRMLEEVRGLDARVRASEGLLEALGPPPLRARLLAQLTQRRDLLAVQQALQIACAPLSALALQGRGATEAELSSLLSQLLRSGSFTLGPLQVQYEPGAAALWIRYDQGPLQLLEGPELLLRVRAQFQIPHRVGAGGRLSLPAAPRISPRAFPCPVCPAPGGRVHTCCTCRHPHHGHAPGQCGCSADGIGPVLILFGARRKPNGRVLVISHCRSCRKKGRPRRKGPRRREPVASAREGRL